MFGQRKRSLTSLLAAGLLLLPGCSSSAPSPEAPSLEEADAPAGSPLASFSKIELAAVEHMGDQVLIEGETDLPDGATVIVTFNVPTKPNELYIGVDEEVAILDRQFSVTLAVPQRKEFETGPYLVEVLFTPKGQSAEVMALVGEDGENLFGPLVQNNFGFNVMELVEEHELDLAVEAPSYPFEAPAEFPSDSPELAVAVFAEAWANEDWSAMVSATQVTWRETEPDPSATLRDSYGFKALNGFEILRVRGNSPVSVDVIFRVWYEAVTNQVEQHEITGRVIKESEPYGPDPNGTWGVNPLSTLREE